MAAGEATALFEQLDADKSGTLDKDELWVKLAMKGDDFATQMIDMVDLNGDGEGCYFLVFVPTIREIRDFNREKYGTNRESVAL
eukprot:SAG31_NODE_9998_length_1198_cov_2.047316_2_plen_84_part_00